jgi:hypothetical protein
MKLTEQMCPKEPVKIELDNYNHSDWLAETQLSDSITTTSHINNLTSPRNSSIVANSLTSPLNSNNQVAQDSRLGNLQLLTAKQLEASPHDEFVGILPNEVVETVIAEQMMLTETDLGHETCQITTAALIDSLKNTPLQGKPNPKTEFWNTSIGRFRFRLDQLPPELQFVYSILTVRNTILLA